MEDPRFITSYTADYRGTPSFKQRNFWLPSSVNERWCEPGYQPKRPDKGFALTVNDYPFHPIQYGASMWPFVVHTPMISPN